MNFMDEQVARHEICRVGKSLFDRGFVHSSAGNISVRLEDGFLITPTDAVLGFLDPARISKVDHSGRHVSGDKPSKTLALHQAIVSASIKSYPNTACVIHTHSTYCVALTLTPNTASDLYSSVSNHELLLPITPYMVMKVGHVPTIAYRRPGAEEVVPEVRDTILGYSEKGIPIRAVMLSALGPLVWHDTPTKAMATLEELEESAKLSFLTRPNNAVLKESQIQELRDVFKAVW
jgi:ribulose-5-phosphate 4-epimerase/fuculose-1-phosphate aldolase